MKNQDRASQSKRNSHKIKIITTINLKTKNKSKKQIVHKKIMKIQRITKRINDCKYRTLTARKNLDIYLFIVFYD